MAENNGIPELGGTDVVLNIAISMNITKGSLTVGFSGLETVHDWQVLGILEKAKEHINNQARQQIQQQRIVRPVLVPPGPFRN